jgi:hypothetical protein
VRILIDILKYKDAKTVEITDVDDVVFSGEVVEVIFPEEKTDLEEQEYSIVLRDGNTEIEFLQSEIKRIDLIE